MCNIYFYEIINEKNIELGSLILSKFRMAFSSVDVQLGY